MLEKTKLAGTQVIDANHILSLIGSKVSTSNGVQTVDNETLRIIYEQIQELSNMGEFEQAKLLKEFVDTELVSGHLSGNLNFDEAFEIWKDGKLLKEVEIFASEWGINNVLLLKSVHSYSISQPDVIPYREDITRSVDFGKATNKTAGNMLKHNMSLSKKTSRMDC
ncbi:hypothetical protein OL548_32355 [Lysinibacillus sp. MHQ-1]|nr:hypothetical protein OL548_32355 [Lysinibacillus sp. MHQ-1]